MLYASAAYAVARCRLSVCPSVELVDSAEMNKYIFKIVTPSVATPFLFFYTKRHGNIPTGAPLMGEVECRWARQNRDY